MQRSIETVPRELGWLADGKRIGHRRQEIGHPRQE
jgi:hypothetical protein